MSQKEHRIVLNRPVQNNELTLVHRIVKSIDLETQGFYFYIDIGKEPKDIITIYKYKEDIILWISDVLGVTATEALYCEGAFPGFYIDLNMYLYDNYIGNVKRYVCLTSEVAIDGTEEYMPEIFCDNLNQAEYYFYDVANVQNIIEVYEEDDRGDYMI